MLSLVLLASMLTTQGPTGPTVKYKFDSKQSTAMDLSAMGQGNQTIEMGLTSFFAVAMSDSANGRILSVVFDSVRVEAGALAGILPDSLISVKPGTTTRVFVAPGKIVPLDGLEKLGMAGAQMLPVFQSLVPKISGSLHVGSSWADTTRADTSIALPDSIKTLTGDLQVGSRSITKWTVAAMDAGTTVLDAVISGTNTMNMMGNEVQGTTTGKQHVTVSRDGVVSTATMESKAAMTMAMAGNTVQIDVTTTGTLTKLP